MMFGAVVVLCFLGVDGVKRDFEICGAEVAGLRRLLSRVYILSRRTVRFSSTVTYLRNPAHSPGAQANYRTGR